MAHHVFVETNWVVDHVAPVISRNSGAAELYKRAVRGEISLHVPSIALIEAKKVIREKSPRDDVNGIRSFVRESREKGEIKEAESIASYLVLTKYESYVRNEKSEAPSRITELAADPNVNVFPLDHDMLDFSTQLAAQAGIELQSFDLSILASVLVRSKQIGTVNNVLSFSTLDRDLQPWDRLGNAKHPLVELYDGASIWVFGDFLLETPARPPHG